MVADEPDFERYPKTPAEFAGVVAKELSGCLLGGLTRLLDTLRHVAVPQRVQRPVRGWEGRIWEVGDGEVDGPVPPGGLQGEGHVVYDPLLPSGETELGATFFKCLSNVEHVIVGEPGDPMTQFPSEEGTLG